MTDIETRNQALEDAAKACEAQSKTFLNPKYMTKQPMSSFGEHFACKQCAAAIRALKVAA
jgi:hypothetical protein